MNGDGGAPSTEAERARIEALLDAVFTKSHDGVVVMKQDGTMHLNGEGEAIMRLAPGSGGADDSWKETWGFFASDGRRIGPEETAGFRAMTKGESVDAEDLRIVSESAPEGFTIQTTARPIPGGGSISIFHDVTTRVLLEQELAERVAELDARESENAALIERLRLALDELSTPVLEVWEHVLVLPVIGVVDTQRSVAMSERLLAEVVRTRARVVIVDVTGLEVLDTSTADRFARIARAVELLGARCLLSGLSPAVARTLVDLGVRFGGRIQTHATLRHALEASFERTNGKGATS
jgi:rsbT co-antagonist protein RsbR